MESRYKIILSGKSIYKEIELPIGVREVTVGTDTGCDIRIRRDIFFEKVQLTFSFADDKWSVRCEEGLYFSNGNVQRLLVKQLVHGDLLSVRYSQSDSELFTLEFLIDFDSKVRRYERVLDIAPFPLVRIGTGQDCHICLSGQFVGRDHIELEKWQDVLILHIQSATFGVYHNGRRAEEGERIENGDFLSLSDYSFYYKDLRLWTEARTDMSIAHISYQDKPTPGEYPKFRKTTRVRTVVNDEAIEILDPPAMPQKPKNNILMRLLPSFGMILAAGVMAFFGGMMIIMSLVSGIMAIVTSILTLREGNKDYEKSTADRIQKYNAYIASKRSEIQQCRSREAVDLEEIYVSQTVAEQRILTFSPELFDRRPGDPDYLCVRLGTGNVEAARKINYKKQERLEAEDELQQYPERVCEEFRLLSNAPVVCDLSAVSAVGIIGSAEQRRSLFRNMVLDLTARHLFTDVHLMFVAEAAHSDDVRELRFLPSVYNDVLGIWNVVADEEGKNIIFEYLYKELTAREQGKVTHPHIVAFFYDEYGLQSHPISKFVGKGKDLGITFVFFGESSTQVPQGCGYLISTVDHQQAVLIDTQDKNKSIPFLYPALSDEKMRSVITQMAPVYTEEVSLEGTLTKNITVFELLDILAAEDLDLRARWDASQVFRSMAAPLGVSKTGLVSLDLHDKADGPHGLVAGTTGSGKSELLQTYILAMATLFHPYDVAFVIIDFKGGGMVNQFRELPHLLGAITNIDGKAINRSLKSIKAELEKRQRLFAEADVNHIDRYIKKYKAGEVSVPLPHLIIVVDEFAELKAEQPEFMKELISAARIGRSLGVHLILATQKPSGQVNEQIWSNSRFKLCLKVQSQEDSNEVLRSPLAAEIKEPGRAYLQVGNNEVFELFQSAYSGAPKRVDDSKVKEFSIFQLTHSGRRVPLYVQRREKKEGESVTQLEAIVEHVAAYCQSAGIQKLPDICLPALKEVIDFMPLTAGEAKNRYYVELGVYDAPGAQHQGVYSVNISKNNVMIIGSARSGKTNLLQTIIRSVSERCDPSEAVLYIVDFASMTLKNFEGLPHVGGVVCPAEDEKLKNLFKLLRTEIVARKEKLMNMGVSSFSAYCEAGRKDLPLIVLMIDNLTALKEMYFQDDDELLELCREGLTVGISVVIANSQTAGIGYRYLSNFSTRISMFCNDSGEYNALFDHCSQRVENIPGRCIVEIEHNHLECQAYLAFRGEREIDRIKEIKDHIARIKSDGNGAMARRIPLIPDVLTEEDILKQFADIMKDRHNVVTGLDYSTVAPHSLDLSTMGTLAIVGREMASVHSWIRYIVSMQEQVRPGRARLYLADGIGRGLEFLKGVNCVKKYSLLPEDAVASMKEIEAQLSQRYAALAAGETEVLENSELLLMIIDNADALSAICNNPEALAAYKNITGKYKNLNVGIILVTENANITFGAPEILRDVREQRQVMFFDDLANFKLFDLPLSSLRAFKKPIDRGDGYYIKDNNCVKLKTAIEINT